MRMSCRCLQVNHGKPQKKRHLVLWEKDNSTTQPMIFVGGNSTLTTSSSGRPMSIELECDGRQDRILEAQRSSNFLALLGEIRRKRSGRILDTSIHRKASSYCMLHIPGYYAGDFRSMANIRMASSLCCNFISLSCWVFNA